MLFKFGKVCWICLTINSTSCFAITSINLSKISIFERCFGYRRFYSSCISAQPFCRPPVVQFSFIYLLHTYFRCNGVEECPNGSDEKGCPSEGGSDKASLYPSIYRGKTLFFATLGFLLVVIIGILFLRAQNQRSKRRKESFPTVSLQVSQMDSTVRAELSHDAPPPYPCNGPVGLQLGRTEASNKGNVSIPLEENSFDVLEESAPPPYSDVLAGVYVQIFPNVCDNNGDR